MPCHNKRCSASIGYIFVLANDHMPNICKISMSIEDPVPEQFAINYCSGLPSYFDIVYKVCVSDVRSKYDIITDMLSGHAVYPNNGFYNLNATDRKIYNIFSLMHTVHAMDIIYCSCEPRTFQVGVVDKFHNYSHIGVYNGMRAKTVAYKIMHDSTEKLRKIILGENTPDQGVRYYRYTVAGDRLVLNPDSIHTKYVGTSPKINDDGEDIDDDAEDINDDAEDINDEGEDNDDADPVLETELVRRGDDRGDITNCLKHGDIVNDTISSDIWLAKYDAVSNILKPIPIDAASGSFSPHSYSRGGESCPIQDFAVAHLKTRGLTHNDNSWTNCSVWDTKTNMFYPIRNVVRDYFGVDN